MVNFFPVFLSPQAWEWARNYDAEQARLKALYPFSTEQVEAALKGWERANPRPRVGISAVADHIEHVAQVAGHDHVGIGGDLDGIPYAADGLESVADYPAL